MRATGLVNAYPPQIHLGASWNRSLIYDIGSFMGAEFKAKGVNVALGPVVGPIGRIAKGGRNWEGFTNDPYLAGQLVSRSVKGLQRTVIACVKHLVGNEQETNRTPSPLDPDGSAISSNIDDKTMHELYLAPFVDAVHAGVASVMCSYNKLNGSYGCQNSKVLNGLLKTELNFPGLVITDWGAQHAGYHSALAGTDMAMPDSTDFWKRGMVPAVQNGSVPESRVDDMAVRILAAWHRLGQDAADYPSLGVGMPSDLTKPHKRVDARDPAARQTLYQAAVEGHVLVKNEAGFLPLKQPKLLSIFGYDAHASLHSYPTQANIGRWALGYEAVNASDEDLVGFFAGIATNYPDAATGGTLITGGGSGASTPSYVSAPYDAFTQQARLDGTDLLWDFTSYSPLVEPESDACIVFVNQWSAEGYDRPSLTDKQSDVLITNVASKCNNTVVVIHNAGIRLVDAWIDHPNIKAVVYAHLPGQESGTAIVDILYGKQAPSGRLPYTVAKKDEDYGNLLNPTQPGTGIEATFPQDNFTEGVYIDYKHFIAQNITPRYAFGYGLTYTTFNYSALSIALYSFVNASIKNTPLPSADAPRIAGGNSALFEAIASVDCRVENTGKVAAAEVAQLYIGIPGGPAKQLRGFEKKIIQPGQVQNFHFELTRRDLSVWDVVQQNWVLQPGSYQVYVGSDVLDTPLRGVIEV